MVTLPNQFVRGSLGKDDLDSLKSVYKILYSVQDNSAIVMSQLIKKFKTVEVGMETYGSKLSCRSLRSARIRASWASSQGGRIYQSGLMMRPGFVERYFSHDVQVQGVWKRHVFAVVNWYKEHEGKDYYGNPVEVWKANEFEHGGPASLLPVQRICGTFAAALETVCNIESLVVCPAPYKVYV